MKEDIIIRSKYSDRMRPFIGKQLIKVLTGQRRVGKSYILKQTMIHISQNDPNANIVYINKENLAFDGIKTANDLNDYVVNNTKEGVINYIFVDEIAMIGIKTPTEDDIMINLANL